MQDQSRSTYSNHRLLLSAIVAAASPSLPLNLTQLAILDQSQKATMEYQSRMNRTAPTSSSSSSSAAIPSWALTNSTCGEPYGWSYGSAHDSCLVAGWSGSIAGPMSHPHHLSGTYAYDYTAPTADYGYCNVANYHHYPTHNRRRRQDNQSRSNQRPKNISMFAKYSKKRRSQNSTVKNAAAGAMRSSNINSSKADQLAEFIMATTKVMCKHKCGREVLCYGPVCPCRQTGARPRSAAALKVGQKHFSGLHMSDRGETVSSLIQNNQVPVLTLSVQPSVPVETLPSDDDEKVLGLCNATALSCYSYLWGDDDSRMWDNKCVDSNGSTDSIDTMSDSISTISKSSGGSVDISDLGSSISSISTITYSSQECNGMVE